MIKKFTSLMLIGLLLNLAFCSTTKANNVQPDAKRAAKVKSAISKLGAGRETGVKIKLLDNTKIVGYISEIGDEDFTIVDELNNKTVPIPYSQVKQLKGKNNLTGAKIVLGLLLTLIVLSFVSIAVSDTGS